MSRHVGRMEGCNPGEVGWAGTLSVDPKKGKVVLYLNRTLLTCRVFFFPNIYLFSYTRS